MWRWRDGREVELMSGLLQLHGRQCRRWEEYADRTAAARFALRV